MQRRVLRWIGVMVCVVAARAAGAAEEPLAAQTLLRDAYLSVVQGELAQVAGQPEDAVAAYRNALQAFDVLCTQYPGWQGELVSYRAADCQNRIQALSAGPAAAEGSNAVPERAVLLAAELSQLRAILGESAPAAGPGEGPEWAVEQEAPARIEAERVKALQGELAALRKENKALARERGRLETRVAKLEKKAGLPSAVAAPQLSPSVLKLEARRLLQEKEQDAAVTLMEEAVGLFPDDEDLVMMLASSYCQGGRYADAVPVLEEAVERMPERASAWILLGTANMGLGRVGDARVAMEKALELAPESSDAHYNMAQILMALTPPALEQARSHYGRSLTLGSPSDVAFEEVLRRATLVHALERAEKKKKE